MFRAVGRRMYTFTIDRARWRGPWYWNHRGRQPFTRLKYVNKWFLHVKNTTRDGNSDTGSYIDQKSECDTKIWKDRIEFLLCRYRQGYAIDPAAASNSNSTAEPKTPGRGLTFPIAAGTRRTRTNATVIDWSRHGDRTLTRSTVVPTRRSVVPLPCRSNSSLSSRYSSHPGEASRHRVDQWRHRLLDTVGIQCTCINAAVSSIRHHLPH